MREKSVSFAIAIMCLSTLSVWGQGGSSGSQSASASGPSASQGSATIENQIISYKVLREIAGEIANSVARTCQCSNVLLTDPNAQSEIVTAKAFHESADALIKAYQSLATIAPPPPKAEIAPTLSDFASLLTAIKSSAVYSNQTFQPTTPSMVTFLTVALHDKNIAVLTSSLPGDLDAGARAVQKKLGEIGDAQQKIKDPKVRSDLDRDFSALRTSLTATGPDGTVLATIIKGEALLNSLGQRYPILNVSIDAAGGDTKVTHFFWRELIMPTPSPSYNGGAVASFLLTDQTGKYLAGNQFSQMYGFSKWKSPKFRP